MLTVRWKDGIAFEAISPGGHTVVLDGRDESLGGRNRGPTPLETFQIALAACTGIDVILILGKKKQKVTEYRIEVDGERAPEGEHPRPFVSMKVRHVLSGENLDPAAVARAVELSDQKYCTVSATLRQRPDVVAEWVIE